MSAPAHVPVLRERVLALLTPALGSAVGDGPDGNADGDVVVDATVGLGGHAAALLDADPRVRLIGLDRDPQALAVCADRLAPYGPRVRLVHAVYDALPQVLADAGVEAVAGVLFDLGVSSMQLDEPGRGFAYAQDGPLDMRMDPGSPLTAEQVVNTYPVASLSGSEQKSLADEFVQLVVGPDGQAVLTDFGFGPPAG